jgi:UDP-glucose:(heptosyl)LPS alpha-1,3-glucosyltransferase
MLFAGSGFRRKGLPEAMAALARINHVGLAVVGRDRPGRWKRLAARLGVARRVFFLGPTLDLVPLYHAADVLVLPSWFDPFPNTGLEALHCGTPLLTTRFAGVCEEIRHGHNGIVIDRPDDIDSLGQGIEQLLALDAEEATARSVSQSVRDLTMQQNVRRTLEAISVLRHGPEGQTA